MGLSGRLAGRPACSLADPGSNIWLAAGTFLACSWHDARVYPEGPSVREDHGGQPLAQVFGYSDHRYIVPGALDLEIYGYGRGDGAAVMGILSRPSLGGGPGMMP